MPGFVLAAVVAAILFALTGFYPPQSEDWIHLQIIAAHPWQSAFDLQVSHSRPLWYLAMWPLLPQGLEHPALLRIPLFLMHVVIGGLVGVLARSLGASPRRALLAVVLFLCFPAVKGLSWILAVSTPEHVLLMLLAMIATVAHVRRPRAATGIALIVLQVLAIGCHSAAALLPGSVAALAIAIAPSGWRVLRERWLLLYFLVGIGLVALLGSLSTAERYHSLRGAGAILANGARALLSLLPEVVRWPAIEGLRGRFGAPGLVLGGAVCLATATAFGWALLRARPVVRGLLVAAAIDLVPPALTAGFVVRYAYFPAALLSVALLLAAKPTRKWFVLLGILGLAWLGDHAVDVAEVRRGGELGIAVVESARAVRAEVGPDRAVALLNPPGEVGAERDVVVFNWGLPKALQWHGIAGPWRFVRTVPYVTSSDVELVDDKRLEQLARDGVAVWRWDEASERFVRR